MTGVLVFIAVFVLLTTRSKRSRRRWKKSLAWCWWLLACGATLVLPSSPAGRGKQVVRTTRPVSAPAAPRVTRKRTGRLWPAPPSRRKHDPSAPRPGQGPRYFTHEQKQILLARAGYQCEHTNRLGIRCHKTTELRADHLHPYSWGGRTILENGQILCDPHNVEKGAHFTDIHDPVLLELVCVPHMLPRNRFRRRVRS